MVDSSRAQPLLRDLEPVALGSEQRLLRHPDVVVEDLRGDVARLPLAEVGVSIVGTSRTIVTPGLSVSTMNADARWCGSAFGSVTPITIRKSARDPFVVNHLRPLITQSPPDLSARVSSRVGIRACAPGSVMLNPDRTSPARSGKEVSLLLFGSADDREDLGIACVRHLVAERSRCQRARSDDLVHEPELHLAEALTTELWPKVGGPTTHAP